MSNAPFFALLARPLQASRGEVTYLTNTNPHQAIMPTLTLDFALFVVFLAINLIVGLSYGRKVRTLHEYALGGKDFSTGTITATIVATWISGSFLTFRLAHMYSDGLFFIILYLFDVGTLLITSLVLAVRMGAFLKNVSIAEAMGKIYGKQIRVITAICSLFLSVGLVALQFKASETIFNLVLGFDSTKTVIIAAGIVIIYSAFGGMRAVTLTDIFQFITFGTVMPILALAIWNHVKDFDAVAHMLQETPQFSLKVLVNTHEKRVGLLSLIPLYLIPAFSPPIFQRASMARDVGQIQRSFLYSSLIYLLLILFAVWITVLIRTDSANLIPEHIFRHVVEQYSYVGL